MSVIRAPTLAGDAIVLAASFTTSTEGNDDGVGIYRSTDLGATWTVHQLASETPTEQYNFAAALDGSSYVLLRSQPAQDFGAFTWVASRSDDGGQSFTDTSSVHNFYPGPLTVADPDNLWTLGGANGLQGLQDRLLEHRRPDRLQRRRHHLAPSEAPVLTAARRSH